MIMLGNTLLQYDRVHAVPAEIGKASRPVPVFDKVKEGDAAPILTIVSTDSNIVFRFS